jgi:uncharacterized protein YjbI with pentapeptide repeats
MLTQRRSQPNEVVGARLSQDALQRLQEFHAAWLAGRSGGRRAMLRDCSLEGCDLSGMDFSEAVLLDCDLAAVAARNTRFTGAILSGTRFDRADLTGADFTAADLQGASFLAAPPLAALPARAGRRRLDAVQVADMVWRHGLWVTSEGAVGIRADFAGADLSAIDLSGRNLCLADFSGAMLPDARLNGALLIAADFRGADLTRVNLAGADLRGANFAGADRRDADFSDARIGPVPGLGLTTRGL